MLSVYVPAAGSIYGEWIARGSGIVGELDKDRQVLDLDFEGNIYEAINIVTFADRVMSAWSRRTTEYPTKARIVGSPRQFVRAGRYDADEGHVLLDDPEALARWLDVDRVAEEELYTTTGDAARQRYWERKARESTDPAVRLVAKQKAKQFARRRRQ